MINLCIFRICYNIGTCVVIVEGIFNSHLSIVECHKLYFIDNELFFDIVIVCVIMSFCFLMHTLSLPPLSLSLPPPLSLSPSPLSLSLSLSPLSLSPLSLSPLSLSPPSLSLSLLAFLFPVQLKGHQRNPTNGKRFILQNVFSNK